MLKKLVATLLALMILPSLASAYDFVVNGRITDDTTGNAISGVSVNGSTGEANGFFISYADGYQLTKHGSATTNSTGNYTISVTFPSSLPGHGDVSYIEWGLDMSKTGYQTRHAIHGVAPPTTADDGSRTLVPN